MKQIQILFLIFFGVNNTGFSQTAEDSVKAVINQLFNGMRNVDAESLKNVFAGSAILQTIRRNADGTFYVQNEAVNKFIESISKSKKDSLDERISFETIKTDGPLASAWTPYKFYYAGIFSHCGVNSFQLVRISGNWKIQYLIDIRRQGNCAN
ncbi:MAG TPA: nuclear transport factor 2 family protein [Chitinophagaceae bacterium]|nr:nuclear transport factor 2 family protein [Chitinophagaceae bacterium]